MSEVSQFAELQRAERLHVDVLAVICSGDQDSIAVAVAVDHLAATNLPEVWESWLAGMDLRRLPSPFCWWGQVVGPPDRVRRGQDTAVPRPHDGVDIVAVKAGTPRPQRELLAAKRDDFWHRPSPATHRWDG